jgi:magnesium transporter
MPELPHSTKPEPIEPLPSEEVRNLFTEALEHSAKEASELLEPHPDSYVETVLELLNPALRQELLDALPRDRRERVLSIANPDNRRQWLRNDAFPENTVGRLMEPALAVFDLDATVEDAIARIRQLVVRSFVAYAFVVDDQERLTGVVAMREMLLSEKTTPLADIMIREPFSLRPDMSLTDAMKATVIRHYPVYPVIDENARLIGLVRGQMLFEAQAIELSAQPGTMVGVEKEERLSTHWWQSLKFRHPWLQLNLVTAFAAAAVVGIFEHTIDRIVVLAVFLPVLAGQSGNTGCQALAVALRGLTLGEIKKGKAKSLVAKEALLGLCNGALVGITAGVGMFVYAHMQHNPSALMLAVIVFLAMIGSCVVSGISGALVPLTLRRLGADPATASSIFLTTATDVVSMGTFLGLATLLI